MMKFTLLSWALMLGTGSVQGAEATAGPRCAAQLQAEQMRIERDFARDRPPATDGAAHERWSRNLQASLTAAGKAAEACDRQSKPALTADRRASMQACIARVTAKLNEVDRKYAGRTLSREEATKLRAEQQALHDERIACDVASKK